MTLQSEVTLLDHFTHTEQEKERIWSFDFISEKPKAISEKIRVEETFCIMVTVGGKFLEKKAFKQVLKKIDEIRKKIRKQIFTNIFLQTLIMPFNDETWFLT